MGALCPKSQSIDKHDTEIKEVEKKREERPNTTVNLMKSSLDELVSTDHTSPTLNDTIKSKSAYVNAVSANVNDNEYSVLVPPKSNDELKLNKL
jgi:hypothetical protein